MSSKNFQQTFYCKHQISCHFRTYNQTPNSDKERLNLALDGLNLGLELTRLVGRDRACDHRAGNVAGSTEGGFGGHEDIGDVLRQFIYIRTLSLDEMNEY